MRYYVSWKTTGYYRKDSLKLAARCPVSGCWLSCLLSWQARSQFRVAYYFGLGRFRYMTVSVHTLSVRFFSVQRISVHWMSISVQSLSVHTKYRYSALWYINVNFGTSVFGTKVCWFQINWNYFSCCSSAAFEEANFLWLPYVIGADIIFLPCDFYLLSFFSSPNLSGWILDVYHTSTHGVALVRI